MKKSVNYYKAKQTKWSESNRLTKMQFNKNYATIAKNHQLMLTDRYYNGFHLSAYSGLINDPNGLAFFNGQFHIFYQWAPFAPIHKNKHWGHYTTKDFINYQNHHLGLEPSITQDIDGVYSGGGLVYQNDYFVYWTGNVKKSNRFGAKRDSSFTLVGKVENNKIINKKVLFEVDHKKYTRNFRDPKPFFHDGKFYLWHGAQKLDQKPVVVLYWSDHPDRDFVFKGEIVFANLNQDLGYMIECPDYFQLDDKDVIVLSLQGKNHFGLNNQNNDQSFFAIGKFNWNTLIFQVEKLQIIDLGFDFYAPQMFTNSAENIMLGWAGVPNSLVYATMDKMWAHSLAFPRLLELKNHHIYQKPLKQLKKLRNSKLQKFQQKLTLNSEMVELFLKPQKEFFELKIQNKNNLSEFISFNYNRGIFEVNRSQMAFVQSEHFGQIWTREINKIDSLQVLIDKSLIEIFINNGEFTFTTKYYLQQPQQIIIKNLAASFYYLKNLTMDWNEPKIVLLPGEALIDCFATDKGNIEYKVGGAPLNVASGIEKWGAKVLFAGAIGKDSYGALIKKEIKKMHLNTQYLIEVAKPTTMAYVSLDKDGERHFSFKRGADAEYFLPTTINFDVLVLSSATAFLGGKLLIAYKSLLLQAIKAQKLIVFDPNYRHDLYQSQLDSWIKLTKYFLNKADIIKLSEKELSIIYPYLNLKQAISRVQKLKAKFTFITMGSKGVLVVSKTKTQLIKSVQVKQIDATGAGDAFLGAFVGQILSKKVNWTKIKIRDIVDLVFKANISAAYTTTQKGGAKAIPSIAKVEKRFMKERAGK